MKYIGFLLLGYAGIKRLNKCNENLRNNLPIFTNDDISEIAFLLSTLALSESLKFNKSVNYLNTGIDILNNI